VEADERLALWAGMSVDELAEVRNATPPWFPSMEEIMELSW
jgi:phosphoserine phosphatase